MTFWEWLADHTGLEPSQIWLFFLEEIETVRVLRMILDGLKHGSMRPSVSSLWLQLMVKHLNFKLYSESFPGSNPKSGKSVTCRWQDFKRLGSLDWISLSQGW